ncbi:MAG: DUF4245 domain-containing protein [Cryobacterium sp.]
MSAAKRPPRIVAELGRPETPEETAARLAENSRTYRSRKTVNNLVLSLLATLATVLVLVLIVPRSDTPIDRSVDYRTVVSQVQSSVNEPLVSPTLPAGWRANAAEWRSGGGDKVASLYIGLLTPGNQFIGLTQGIDANPSWVSQQLQGAAASDTLAIDGVRWDVYRNAAPEGDRGNFDTALVTTAGASTYLLIGTATEAEFEALAGELAGPITQNVGGLE